MLVGTVELRNRRGGQPNLNRKKQVDNPSFPCPHVILSGTQVMGEDLLDMLVKWMNWDWFPRLRKLPSAKH